MAPMLQWWTTMNHRLIGLLFVMAILLAGRAMFTATSRTTTHFVLPLDFLAASASTAAWKSQYQQQPNTTITVKQQTSSSLTMGTTMEFSAAGSSVKDLRQERSASGSVFFRTENKSNPQFYFDAETSVRPLVIFYNIFIPPETDADDDDVVIETGRGAGGGTETIRMSKIQNALRIVTEQIQQIRQSHTASSSSSSNTNNNNNNNIHTTLTVFYNTIGNPTALNHSFMQNVCTGAFQSASSNGPRQSSLPKIHCRHLQHFLVGHEEETLNHLHNFCWQHANHSVVYLHSKGSFHHRPYNEAWRPHLTAAATSRLCWDAIVGGTRSGGGGGGSSSGNSRSSACNLVHVCTRQHVDGIVRLRSKALAIAPFPSAHEASGTDRATRFTSCSWEHTRRRQ
jgi:hypothetical protein